MQLFKTVLADQKGKDREKNVGGYKTETKGTGTDATLTLISRSNKTRPRPSNQFLSSKEHRLVSRTKKETLADMTEFVVSNLRRLNNGHKQKK